MAWVLLGIAGVLEVVWAFFMKKSNGFTETIPTVITIGAMIISFKLLSEAMKVLPLGTSYAVWTGIGAAGSFILGIAFLGEPATLMRIVAALMIVGGILLLRFAS